VRFQLTGSGATGMSLRLFPVPAAIFSGREPFFFCIFVLFLLYKKNVNLVNNGIFGDFILHQLTDNIKGVALLFRNQFFFPYRLPVIANGIELCDRDGDAISENESGHVNRSFRLFFFKF
jgi:hypothetical protein